MTEESRKRSAQLFASRLNELLRARFSNINQLAKETGISYATLHAYSKGERLPTHDNAQAIADALKVSIDYFVDDPLARSKSHVFLILAAFQEEWQGELQNWLLRYLNEKGFTCEPKIPSEDYRWEHHVDFWRRVIQERRHFAGGIAVVPVWEGDQAEEIKRFAAEFGKPVILVDRTPKVDEKIPENVTFVSVPDHEGGVWAAKALIDLPEVELKRVLVLTGNAKRDRVDFFKQRLLRARPGCKIIVSTETDFNRDKAAEIAHQYLKEGLRTKNPFQAVFNATDSNALGAWDAVCQLFRDGGIRPPILIGYDGVQETRHLVKSGLMAAIVVQDARAVAHRAVETLVKRVHLSKSQVVLRESIAPSLIRATRLKMIEESE